MLVGRTTVDLRLQQVGKDIVGIGEEPKAAPERNYEKLSKKV